MYGRTCSEDLSIRDFLGISTYCGQQLEKTHYAMDDQDSRRFISSSLYISRKRSVYLFQPMLQLNYLSWLSEGKEAELTKADETRPHCYSSHISMVLIYVFYIVCDLKINSLYMFKLNIRTNIFEHRCVTFPPSHPNSFLTQKGGICSKCVCEIIVILLGFSTPSPTIKA